MTIKKIINTFDYIKHVGNGESEYKHCREEIALDEAVTILRKYQKIKEIIQHWIDEDLASESPSFADSGTIEDIIEVIEDGND